MVKYKVLFTDTIYPDTKIEEAVLDTIGAELVMAGGTTEDELIEAGRGCDGVMNIFAKLTSKVLDNWPKCRVIARSGVGIDTIDMEAANRNKIMVANVPDFGTDAVADHTVALFFAASRKILQYDKSIRNGVWDFGIAKPIHKLEAQNFCLLGFGRISQFVARRCKPFGFNLYAYDPYTGDEVFEELGVTRVNNIEELASIADIFSLHLPLSNDTRGIINIDLMRKMKQNVIIINTSRGPLIKEEDLVYALKNGIIGSCALDVLTSEPPKMDNELLKMDNVILTPHAAFYTEESVITLRQRTMQEVVYALTEGQPRRFVNKKNFE